VSVSEKQSVYYNPFSSSARPRHKTTKTAAAKHDAPNVKWEVTNFGLIHAAQPHQKIQFALKYTF
jgi:hypothetical protein